MESKAESSKIPRHDLSTTLNHDSARLPTTNPEAEKDGYNIPRSFGNRTSTAESEDEAPVKQTVFHDEQLGEKAPRAHPALNIPPESSQPGPTDKTPTADDRRKPDLLGESVVDSTPPAAKPKSDTANGTSDFVREHTVHDTSLPSKIASSQNGTIETTVSVKGQAHDTNPDLLTSNTMDWLQRRGSDEAWGMLAQFVAKHIPKPKRDGPNGTMTLKAAANYFIKVNRIRQGVGEALVGDESRCRTCVKLDLAVEKFLVKDRVTSRKDSRLFKVKEAYRSSYGRFDFGTGARRFKIGDLRSIWKRSVFCTVCRLVLQSLTWQPKGEWIQYDYSPESGRFQGHGDELEAKCYATWQIDGRELIRDPSGKVINSQARTRRIRVQWEPDVFEESYLVLMAGPSFMVDFFLGTPVPTARAHVGLMTNWIESCCAHHGGRCRREKDDRFALMVKRAYFGVIDVKDMKLVRLPSIHERYVALSYTWGPDEPRFKSLLSNIRRSQKSLESVREMLPRTVQDAIKLVGDMGQRYLWVDSICIVQDSHKSWELNAGMMDVVYGNAYFTICAADGNNSEAGLRGVSTNQAREFKQAVGDYSNELRIMASYPVEAYINRSAWNKRAWTFQERLLSQRCLIFTDSRVFFQCRSTTMREDIKGEEKHGWSVDHAKAPLRILDHLETRPILLYTNSVELYTSRQLSRSENILAAFKGIGNMMGKYLGAPLLHGLPRSHFDWALLWEPREKPDQRLICRLKGDGSINKDGSPATHMVAEFPSWSWCGWQNAVIEYKIHETLMGSTTDLHEWLIKHTWIDWHVRDGYGSIKPVWDKDVVSDVATTCEEEWRGYDKSKANEDNMHGRSKTSSVFPPETNQTRNLSFSLTIPEYPFGVHIGDEDDDPQASFEDQKYLQFFTWSAYLQLGDHVASHASRAGKGLKRYGIMDYKRDWCGTIVLDDGYGMHFSPGQEYEFIALSEAKHFTKEESDGWMYYVPHDREQSEWDLYYVLLIEVKDEIAYRVGLGKVYKEAFENSCRQEKEWKEFIMG